ncbi:HEAT repeat domain-containing protein [Proteiniclasticum ruminis]|uniref:HEAT repeat-containing protein n=1 Tax=Proteiniclasticum ruminis TaxID=398199 RepID=A0A1G8IB74_9CLOT|nr:HEAT repeat domain-containing protein [Proteiniclasticum ruminis]SDI16146.1 hypothetical protein SAMN05421804_101831 [Proteiniclasticum ruminis]
MIVNVILYSYFFICMLILSYTVFYIFYNYYRKFVNRRLENKWKVLVSQQIQRQSKIGTTDSSFRKRMERDLKKPGNLMNFHLALESFNSKEEAFRMFLHDIEDSIVKLAMHYGTKGVMEKSYFCQFFSAFNKGQWSQEKLLYVFLEYLKPSTVYVRESVLKAIYSCGHEEWVLRFFSILTEENWFHHPKLLGDGLVLFTGDRESLAKALCERRDTFSDFIQQGIIQFISLTSDRYQEEMLQCAVDESKNLEIRLAALRYLKKYPYEKARPFLYDYLLNRENLYQLRVVSARTLGSYTAKETVEVLKEALHDPNWYVRFNVSESLIELKVNLVDLKEIFLDDDKYAKDILLYRISERRGR